MKKDQKIEVIPSKMTRKSKEEPTFTITLLNINNYPTASLARALFCLIDARSFKAATHIIVDCQRSEVTEIKFVPRADITYQQAVDTLEDIGVDYKIKYIDEQHITAIENSEAEHVAEEPSINFNNDREIVMVDLNEITDEHKFKVLSPNIIRIVVDFRLWKSWLSRIQIFEDLATALKIGINVKGAEDDEDVIIITFTKEIKLSENASEVCVLPNVLHEAIQRILRIEDYQSNINSLKVRLEEEERSLKACQDRLCDLINTTNHA